MLCPKFTADKADIFAFLETCDERDALKQETIVVLSPGSALYVPFGWFVVSCPQTENRQTKQLLSEKLKAKKKKIPRKSAADQPGSTYSAVSFLPHIENTVNFADAFCGDAVRVVSANLTFNASKIPSSLRSNPAWKSWVEALEKKAKSSSASVNEDGDCLVVPGKKTANSATAAATPNVE